MTQRTDHPSESEIQAWIDGELPADHPVARHCASCSDCGRIAEACARVRDLLASGTDIQPPNPMWPAVRDAMSRGRSPRYGFTFAVGAVVAAAVGIILGVLVGGAQLPSAANGEADLWSTVGSSVADESGSTSTLSDVYLVYESTETSQ